MALLTWWSLSFPWINSAYLLHYTGCLLDSFSRDHKDPRAQEMATAIQLQRQQLLSFSRIIFVFLFIYYIYILSTNFLCHLSIPNSYSSTLKYHTTIRSGFFFVLFTNSSSIKIHRILGVKHRTLHILGKWSIPELHLYLTPYTLNNNKKTLTLY